MPSKILFNSDKLQIINLGLHNYLPILNKMENYIKNYNKNISKNISKNIIWLLEHNPIYTQGRAGKPEHILRENNIPVIKTSRGGQVTYHGPGQLIAYFLFDLKKTKIGPRQFVHTIENIIINLLKNYNITAHSNPKAPGIYIKKLDDAKICSIGLRITQGLTYHGLSLNINMDLTPFNDINPCGYEDLKICQISDLIPNISVQKIIPKLTTLLSHEFG